MPRFEQDSVVKAGSPASDELLCEAAGLRWLAEAEGSGGIHIARVREASRERLVEERIETGCSMRKECSSSERLEVSELSSSTLRLQEASLSLRLDTISRNGRNSAP